MINKIPKKVRIYTIGIVVALPFLMLPTIQITYAVLPTGNWNINGNGFRGDLVINSVDSAGRITGTVYNGQTIIGFWDESSQKITFMRIIEPSDPSTFQIFTGYLFRNCDTGGCLYTLAGSFEAFAGTGAVAQRTLYGWFAQIFG